MDAREEILTRIRTANLAARGEAAGAVDVPRAYDRDPDVAGPATDEVIDALVQRLNDYGTHVVRVSPDGIAAAVDAELGDATSVVVPPGLDPAWVAHGEREVTVDDGTTYAALDAIAAVVTACRVACAVSGTIGLDAMEPDQGRRAVSLIPDRHVCVVRTDQVVATVGQMLARVDPTHPNTLFSGPSATVDIELERVQGVHGPRDLHVVLVDVAG